MAADSATAPDTSGLSTSIEGLRHQVARLGERMAAMEEKANRFDRDLAKAGIIIDVIRDDLQRLRTTVELGAAKLMNISESIASMMDRIDQRHKENRDRMWAIAVAIITVILTAMFVNHVFTYGFKP
jgi:chromosome segregation ATPase